MIIRPENQNLALVFSWLEAVNCPGAQRSGDVPQVKPFGPICARATVPLGVHNMQTELS